MFNSIFKEFEEDPFFTDPFRAHREHTQHILRSFSEPFGGSFMPSLTDGRNQDRSVTQQPTTSQALRNNQRDILRNPFGVVDNMRNKVHKDFENMSTDLNSHSFSSSSVMTYSKVGNEPAKVFQACSSTRRAPGGIKETQRAIRDSESGLEKMSIGHHIQERGHVVEKKYNNRTGEKELNQDFQNMDESEAQAFDEQWQQEVSKFKPSGSKSQKPRSITFNQERDHREPKVANRRDSKKQ